MPDDETPAFTPDPGWSGWNEDSGFQYCMDPWVIRHDDRFIMYYICLNRRGDSCIAVAFSEDPVNWRDEGPNVTTRWIDDPLLHSRVLKTLDAKLLFFPNDFLVPV